MKYLAILMPVLTTITPAFGCKPSCWRRVEESAPLLQAEKSLAMGEATPALLLPLNITLEELLTSLSAFKEAPSTFVCQVPAAPSDLTQHPYGAEAAQQAKLIVITKPFLDYATTYDPTQHAALNLFLQNKLTIFFNCPEGDITSLAQPQKPGISPLKTYITLNIPTEAFSPKDPLIQLCRSKAITHRVLYGTHTHSSISATRTSMTSTKPTVDMLKLLLAASLKALIGKALENPEEISDGPIDTFIN